jgi:type II secretory pathway component PulF
MKILDFKYRAKLLNNGKVVKGNVEAPSKTMATKFLQENGMKPIEVYEKKSAFRQLSRVSLGRVIKERDLLFYLRQMHSLLRAGVKLNEACEMLATQQTNAQVRRILYGIYYEVNSGTPLADAYSEYPKDFPDILISMIRVGEQTGNLRVALDDIIHYFETQFKIKSSITQTMMMPAIYMTIAVGVAIFLFTVVMPNFESMFDDLGGDLPPITAAFIGIGNFITQNGIMIGLGLIIFIVVFSVLKRKSKEFQRFLSAAAIRMPILGQVVQLNNLSRIAATLSQLLNNKIPLQDCLASTYDVINNRVYRDILVEAQKNVNSGDLISKAFENHYAVEVIFVRMISVGERTGELGRMLKNLSSFYDEDSVSKIERVRKLLEPVMMIVIFGMVVVMLLAIMLPSLSFSSALS